MTTALAERMATARDTMPDDDYAAMLAQCLATPCYCQPCDNARLIEEASHYTYLKG